MRMSHCAKFSDTSTRRLSRTRASVSRLRARMSTPTGRSPIAVGEPRFPKCSRRSAPQLEVARAVTCAAELRHGPVRHLSQRLRPVPISVSPRTASNKTAVKQDRSRNMPISATVTPATISEGARGPTVSWLQYLLVRRTLSDNQVDGVFGPVTKAAVKQFQGAEHIDVDGVVGPATWLALGGDGPEPPTLSQGSHGAVVKKLQTAPNEGRGGLAPSANPG